MLSNISRPGSMFPPESPHPWLWRCHVCGTNLPLGITRRCLNDGHYFCAGTTINKQTGKPKKHAPCSSTFDYFGWEEYNEWRQQSHALRKRAESGPYDTTSSDTDSGPSVSAHSCERDCNFPSDCRWKQQSASTATTRPFEARETKIHASRSAPTSNPSGNTAYATRSLSDKCESIPNQADSRLTSKLSTKSSVRQVSKQEQRGFSLPFSPSFWFLTSTESLNPRRDDRPPLHDQNKLRRNPQTGIRVKKNAEPELIPADVPTPLRIMKQPKTKAETPASTLLLFDHAEKTPRYNLRPTRQRLSIPETEEIAVVESTMDKAQSPVQILLDWSLDSVTGAWGGSFGMAGEQLGSL